MKKYKEYMDNVRASDTLHQRLLGLEASGKRPVPWKRYGTMAAALALVVGLGAWGLSRGGWDAVAANYKPDANAEPGIPDVDFPEIAHELTPDIALVEPGDVAEPGEKTIGGYEVISGSGENAIATYYVLPYIDYGGMKPSAASSTQVAADWDIPQGAVRRDLTQDEIITLLGGDDAVATHLDWGAYELTGRAWEWPDGCILLACIYGYAGPLDHFEFSIMDGELPPTCIAYPESVTQEVRGLTVTADKYDGEHGCDRRVSFMKDGCGYCFDLTSTDAGQAELLVSRLVCRVADKGMPLAYTCDLCGNTFPVGTFHNDPNICHYPLYDPSEAADPHHNATGEDDPYICTGYPTPDPEDGGMPDMGAPPVLKVVCGGDSLEAGGGNYRWKVDLGNGLTSDTIACGLHPLDFREAPSLTTAADTAKLSFAGSPDRVRVVCWPDSEWGNTGAASQECLVARSSLTLDYELSLEQGGWIYELTAEWDGYGAASYVFYLIKN